MKKPTSAVTQTFAWNQLGERKFSSTDWCLVTKANEVKLIDFNWAGEDGQAKYPSLISSDIKWAAGVEALGVIEKAHDLVMFNRLFPEK